MNLINKISMFLLPCLFMGALSADEYPAELYFPNESGYNHTDDIRFPSLNIDLGFDVVTFFDEDGNQTGKYVLRRSERLSSEFKDSYAEFLMSLVDENGNTRPFSQQGDITIASMNPPAFLSIFLTTKRYSIAQYIDFEFLAPYYKALDDNKAVEEYNAQQQRIAQQTSQELGNTFQGDKDSFSEIVDDMVNKTFNDWDEFSFDANEYTNNIIDQILEKGFIEEEVAPVDKDPKASVGDPVDVITGDFYVNETDLVLHGPLPLAMSRNYLSSNRTQSSLGYGWKPNLFPFLSLIDREDGTTIIRAAEFNGTTLTYVQNPDKPDEWVVIQSVNASDGSANHGLTNSNSHGGVAGNKLCQRIERSITLAENGEEQVVFTLHGSQHDTRVYKFRSFPIGEIRRYRPYLESWVDAHGNAISFTYGELPYLNDYGQLVSARASNGNYLNFEYDNAGRITAAYANDGRRVVYRYDAFGDLRSVVRPDGSWMQYDYKTRITENDIEYSTHLITAILQPNGRLLTNEYDSENRVVEQHATVGEGLELIRNASYYYAHTGRDNGVSGYTKVYDFRELPSMNPSLDTNCTTYEYTHGKLTQITDTLGYTTEQGWYTTRVDYPSPAAVLDSTTARIEEAGNRAVADDEPGGFPNSLKYSVDKRGLVTYYWYDAKGNVVLTKTYGDITGDGVADVVERNQRYNELNLPTQAQSPHMNDPTGFTTTTDYDSEYVLNPQQVTSQVATVPVSQQSFAYGSFADGETFAKGLPTWIRTGLEGEQSHVTLDYDGRGFLSEKIRYAATGTATVPTNDPQAIELGMLHDERGNVIVLEDFKTGLLTEYQYDLMNRQRSAEIFDRTDTLISSNYTYYNENGEVAWIDGPRIGVDDYVYSTYDAAGRLSTSTFWLSQASDDGSGIEATPTEAHPTQRYVYDAYGNLIQSIQPGGDYTRCYYDTLGQLLEKQYYDGRTDALLATEFFSYEPGGQIATHTDPLGAVTRYQYNDYGQRITHYNPDGSVLHWEYYLDGSLRKETLPNGSYWLYKYGQGADKRQVHGEYYSAGDVLLGRNEKHYNSRGEQVAFVDMLGHRFEYAYDGLNRKVRETGPAGDSKSARQEMTFTYSEDGLASTQINALQEKIEIERDVLGRMIATKAYNTANELVRFTQVEYASDFNSQTTISGDGSNNEAIIRTRTFTNTLGSPVLTQHLHDATGDSYDFSINRYDIDNLLVEAVDEVGQVTRMRYDGLGRAIALTRPDGAESGYRYDAAGNLLEHSMPRGLTLQRSYDAIGRLHEEKLRSGSQVSRHFKYNYYKSPNTYVGRLHSIEDLSRNIRTEHTVYDDFGRPKQIVHSGSPEIAGFTQSFAYDLMGRLKENTINYSSSLLKDTTVTMTYDAYGQVRGEETLVDGTVHQTWSQFWNAAGRREKLSSVKPGARIDYTYGYDPDGRLNQVTESLGKTAFQFAYGQQGLLQECANPWLKTQVLARDERGFVLQSLTTTQANPAVDILAETLTWRDDARLSSHSTTRTGNLADGTSIGDRNRTFTYNSRKQLIEETWTVDGGQNNALTYHFDSAKLGVLTRMERTGDTVSEQHPWCIPNGRLNDFAQPTEELMDGAPLIAQGRAPGASEVMLELSDGSTSYALTDIEFDTTDPNRPWSAAVVLSAGSHSLTATAQHPSGIAEKTVTHEFSIQPGSVHDSNQRIQSFYDESGYLKTKTLWDGRSQEFTWDAAGRLLSIKDLNADGVSGKETVYTFDGFGRRLLAEQFAIVNGNTGARIRNENSYFDPAVEFLELGASRDAGAVQWKVYGPDQNGQYGGLQGIGGLAALIDSANNAVTAVVSDALGNVVAAVSGAASNPDVVWNVTEISGYGAVPDSTWEQWDANNTLIESIAWLGYRLDLSGYIWMGARFYDSTSGRFLSPDPLGHAASMDLYSYADGDPINFIDPTGRDSQGNYGEGDPIGKDPNPMDLDLGWSMNNDGEIIFDDTFDDRFSDFPELSDDEIARMKFEAEIHDMNKLPENFNFKDIPIKYVDKHSIDVYNAGWRGDKLMMFGISSTNIGSETFYRVIETDNGIKTSFFEEKFKWGPITVTEKSNNILPIFTFGGLSVDTGAPNISLSVFNQKTSISKDGFGYSSTEKMGSSSLELGGTFRPGLETALVISGSATAREAFKLRRLTGQSTNGSLWEPAVQVARKVVY